MALIYNVLYRLLNKRKDSPNDELYRYALLLCVAASALCVYAVLTIYFFVCNCIPLVISHSIGIIVNIVAMLTLRLRHYDGSALIVSLMILISTLTIVFYVGANNYAVLYQILVLLIVMVVPFDKKQIPIILGWALPPLMIATYLFDLNHVPPYDIGIYNDILGIINIVMASTAVILIIWLEKRIRSFVDAYYQERLDELQNQAYHDSLTQLYNRHYAEMYFSEANRAIHAERYLALIDIDDFKVINDTYGHDKGDEVLKTLSTILDNNTRRTDVVFRWGGEEFLILINDANQKGALALLEKVRISVEETLFSVEDDSFSINITVGTAELKDSVEACLKECDTKMYYGKRSGKNMVVI